MSKIYLDNGATTKVDKEVVRTMEPYFTEYYGNASSIHSYGQTARKAADKAKKILADNINADPDEIIFTSGGTESNNTALKVVAELKKKEGKNQIIISKIEHPSIIETCKFLKTKGFEVIYLDVDEKGIIKPDQLKKSLTPKTALVSIMHANNEVGVIQPVKDIGRLCRENNTLFHTDAVQSFTKVKLDVKECNIDLASFSAHKLHGPKGIGVLYARKGINLKSFLHGGHQENSRRAGTENIPAIVGFGKAVELAEKIDLDAIKNLRRYMLEKILKEIPNSRLNGDEEKRLQNNINVSFDYIEGEALLTKLDEKGIAVSTGSACSSKNLEPSHVLTAMGLTPVQAHGSIRITLSKHTKKEELDYTVLCIKKAVEELRELSPLC